MMPLLEQIAFVQIETGALATSAVIAARASNLNPARLLVTLLLVTQASNLPCLPTGSRTLCASASIGKAMRSECWKSGKHNPSGANLVE
ncbi:hypothetical protein ACO2I3_11515 [Leptospira interrogans]